MCAVETSKVGTNWYRPFHCLTFRSKISHWVSCGLRPGSWKAYDLHHFHSHHSIQWPSCPTSMCIFYISPLIYSSNVHLFYPHQSAPFWSRLKHLNHWMDCHEVWYTPAKNQWPSSMLSALHYHCCGLDHVQTQSWTCLNFCRNAKQHHSARSCVSRSHMCKCLFL